MVLLRLLVVLPDEGVVLLKGYRLLLDYTIISVASVRQSASCVGLTLRL